VAFSFPNLIFNPSASCPHCGQVPFHRIWQSSDWQTNARDPNESHPILVNFPLVAGPLKQPSALTPSWEGFNSCRRAQADLATATHLFLESVVGIDGVPHLNVLSGRDLFRAIKHFAHLAHQVFLRKRFLNEENARVQNPMVRDRVIRIPRHVDHPYI
jgi:hypothetical protein